MTLETYLYKQLVATTAKQYLRRLTPFFVSLEGKAIDSKLATYQDILNYIGELRAKKTSPRDSLNAIKKYYDYLILEGIREDHPARTIKLKDQLNRQTQLQDLFTTKELEQLLEEVKSYPGITNRNRSIVSLLSYQGLTTLEITRLKVQDIDLEKATVFVREGAKSKARTLKLRGNQILMLFQYLEKERTKLKKISTELFFISTQGSQLRTQSIAHLVGSYQYLFSNRTLNPKAIRKSVITNLLKSGKNLRIVQEFAGHRNPSSTQQYQQTKVEELKQQILKYHPLK